MGDSVICTRGKLQFVCLLDEYTFKLKQIASLVLAPTARFGLSLVVVNATCTKRVSPCSLVTVPRWSDK